MIRYDNTNHNDDVTRIGWKDLIKEKSDKNDGYERLQNNIFLNKSLIKNKKICWKNILIKIRRYVGRTF